MTRVRVEGFTISLNGYGAGPNQDINNPLGVGGTELHQWLVPTRTLQRALFGKDGGARIGCPRRKTSMMSMAAPHAGQTKVG